MSAEEEVVGERVRWFETSSSLCVLLTESSYTCMYSLALHSHLWPSNLTRSSRSV